MNTHTGAPENIILGTRLEQKSNSCSKLAMDWKSVYIKRVDDFQYRNLSLWWSPNDSVSSAQLVFKYMTITGTTHSCIVFCVKHRGSTFSKLSPLIAEL